jgi:fucose permease
MKKNHPAWIGIGLAFYAFIVIGMIEGSIGVILPSLQATYTLTTASVAPLFFSQLAGYVVAALFNGWLIQRLGLARMLLVASVILGGTLCLYGFSPAWAVMVVGGAVAGLGIGLIDAGINTYIADDQRNAHLMGMLHAFYGIGSLMGPAIATTGLALGLDWRTVYFIFASFLGLSILGLLWAVLVRYQPMMQNSLMQNSLMQNSLMQSSLTPSTAPISLVKTLKIPSVLVSGLLLLVYVGMETALSDWSYSVQTLSRGTPNLLAGYSVSAYWLGLTLGRVGMGRMVAKLGAVRTIDFSLLLLALGAASWWLLPFPFLSLPMIGLGLGPIFPISIWLMPQRVSPAIAPTAIGFMTSAGSVGAAAIPAMVGWMAQQLGLEVIPLLMLFLVVSIAGLHRWLVSHAPLVAAADSQL